VTHESNQRVDVRIWRILDQRNTALLHQGIHLAEMSQLFGGQIYEARDNLRTVGIGETAFFTKYT